LHGVWPEIKRHESHLSKRAAYIKGLLAQTLAPMPAG
jgi:hypothetical protein